jgi:hypothetical protein
MEWTFSFSRVQMNSSRRCKVATAISVAVGATGIVCVAHAQRGPALEPAKGGCCERSFWVGPTYQYLFGDAFEPSLRHGAGLSTVYEFHVSPRFNLGLNLAYRLYPGEQLTHQVGYGAILKHFFSEGWDQRDGLYPFVDYGLLLQQTFIGGREGNAVSHDTRMGLGLLARSWGVPVFASLAGHYSRLTFFDREGEWIPYVEAQLGWVHAF